MADRKVRISKHAKKRLKERNGLNKKSLDRMTEKAYRDGYRLHQLSGRLHKWCYSHVVRPEDKQNLRIYGDKLYIFGEGRTLITILQVPSNLMKDLDKMIKEK